MFSRFFFIRHYSCLFLHVVSHFGHSLVRIMSSFALWLSCRCVGCFSSYKYCRTCFCISLALGGLLCPGTFVEARRLYSLVREVLQFIVCFCISSTPSLPHASLCNQSPPLAGTVSSPHYRHFAQLCVSWDIFRQVFPPVRRRVTQAGPAPAMIIYHGRVGFCLP